MNRKKTQILLSILHICVFGIGVLFIYHSVDPVHTSMAVMPDSTLPARDIEIETETVPELIIKSETEPETESETALESVSAAGTETTYETEIPTAETAISYRFQYTRGKRNLNIRNAPSINGGIIGRIPPNDGGSILELTNDEWALIEYRGITGYSSLSWMDLIPVDGHDMGEE